MNCSLLKVSSPNRQWHPGHFIQSFNLTACHALFFLRWPLLGLDVVEVLNGGRVGGVLSDRRRRPGRPELRPGRGQRRQLVTLGEHPTFCLPLPPQQLLEAFEDEVDHFADAHEDTDGGGDHHEEGEDPLLCGTRDEAVHGVGTGLQGALGQAGHVVTLVDVVEDVQEAGVEACLEDQTYLKRDR